MLKQTTIINNVGPTQSTMDTFKKYKSDWKFVSEPVIQVKSPYLTTSDAFKEECVTFQQAAKVTLITGQWFGLNPVLGVSDPDASKLRFTFYSWRFLYTMLSLAGQSASLSLCVIKMLKDTDSSLSSNTSTIFLLTATMTTVIFLRIATKWPKLCVQIAKTEVANPNTDTTLIRKCNLACLVILSLAFLEHALSVLSGIAITIECISDTRVYEEFIKQSYPWMYAFIPYNHVIGVISQLLNLQCTFNWNFADLFVICISMYLTSRLDQINQRIDDAKEKYSPASFWQTIREDYTRVTWLVRMVDDIIGGVVFISFANNLFFICRQLLYTLSEGVKASPRCRTDVPDQRPLHGYEQAVYFIYSFGFLVIRSLAVSIAASGVHTASKTPAHALYSVCSATYCVEIQRFLDQIHGDNVSLSGLQFFSVKRGLILSIAGTIVTYELVLMQFTGVTPTSPPLNTD